MAGILLVLASCSKRTMDQMPVEPQAPTLSLDLNTFTYEEMLTKLTQSQSLEQVELIDGDSTYQVSLDAVTNLTSGDEPVLMLESSGSSATDFTDVTVTPECVAIRLYHGGHGKAWVIYSDPAMQTAVEDAYAGLNVTTKSGAPALTKGSEGSAMCFDMTAIASALTTKAGNFEVPRDANIPQSAATKSGNSYTTQVAALREKFVPQSATKANPPMISIYMIREKGANPIYHEMQWQVKDAQYSLSNVNWYICTQYYTRDTDFRGSNDAENDLYDFRDWVRSSQFKNTDGVFMLCRWGGWGNSILGMAFMDDYNVNYDRQGYGVSCTTCWYKCNMAHEVGHIFGAEHVEMKWYDYIANSDLMCPQTSGPFKNWKHVNTANRQIVSTNLTVK